MRSLSALGKLGVSQFSLSWSQLVSGWQGGRIAFERWSAVLLGAPYKPPRRRLALIPYVPSSELPGDAENKVDWLVGTRGISFCDTGQCD